jgi:hypothetical protein
MQLLDLAGHFGWNRTIGFPFIEPAAYLLLATLPSGPARLGRHECPISVAQSESANQNGVLHLFLALRIQVR